MAKQFQVKNEPMIGKEGLKELKAKLEQEARFVKLSA